MRPHPAALIPITSYKEVPPGVIVGSCTVLMSFFSVFHVTIVPWPCRTSVLKGEMHLSVAVFIMKPNAFWQHSRWHRLSRVVGWTFRCLNDGRLDHARRLSIFPSFVMIGGELEIGHSRVSKSLTFQTRVSEKPFLCWLSLPQRLPLGITVKTAMIER